MMLLPLLVLLIASVYGEKEPESHTVPASINLDNMANEEQSLHQSDTDSMPSGNILLEKTDDDKKKLERMTGSAMIQPGIKFDAMEEEESKAPEGGAAPEDMKGGKLTMKESNKHMSRSATIQPDVRTEEVADDSNQPEGSGVLKGKSVRKLKRQKITRMTGSATIQPAVMLGNVENEQLDTPKGGEAPQGDKSEKMKEMTKEHMSGSASLPADSESDGDEEVTVTREGGKLIKKRVRKTKKTKVQMTGSATLPPDAKLDGGEEEPKTPEGGEFPKEHIHKTKETKVQMSGPAMLPPGTKLDGEEEEPKTPEGGEFPKEHIHKTKKTKVQMTGSATLPPDAKLDGSEEEPKTPEGGEFPKEHVHKTKKTKVQMSGSATLPPGTKLDGSEEEPKTPEGGEFPKEHVHKMKETNVQMSGPAMLPPGTKLDGSEEEPKTPEGGKLPNEHEPEGGADKKPKTPEDDQVPHEHHEDTVKEGKDRPNGSATIQPSIKMVGINESPTAPKIEPINNKPMPGEFLADKPSDSQPDQQPQSVGTEPVVADTNVPPHVPDMQHDSQLPRVNYQPIATVEKGEPPVGILPAVGIDRKPEQQCTAMEQAIGSSCYCKDGFVRIQGAGCKPLQCTC